jgi:hypothetical protein
MKAEMDVPKFRFRACVIVEKIQDMVLLVLPALIAFPCVVTSVLGFTIAENVSYLGDGKQDWLPF